MHPRRVKWKTACGKDRNGLRKSAYVYACVRVLNEPELSFSICRWLTKLISGPRLGGTGGPNLGAWGYVSEMKWGNAEQRIAAKLQTYKTMLITAGVTSFILMRWSSGGGCGGYVDSENCVIWMFVTWNIQRTTRRCWRRQSHMRCELMRSDGDWPVDPYACWEVNRSARMTEALHKGVWQSNLHRCLTHTPSAAAAVYMSPVNSCLWRREHMLLPSTSVVNINSNNKQL